MTVESTQENGSQSEKLLVEEVQHQETVLQVSKDWEARLTTQPTPVLAEQEDPGKIAERARRPGAHCHLEGLRDASRYS